MDVGFGPGVAKPAFSQLATVAPGTIPNGGANAGTQGAFGPVVSWPIIGLHEILLPDGRVMNYGTNQQGQQGAQLVYDVWDPSVGTGSNAHTVLSNTTTTDIFCSGQSVMWGSGDVLITGGDLTIGGQRNFSNNDTTIFSPQSNSLSSGATMQYPRWYSSVIAQPDGEMLVLGGRQNPTTPTITPEVYTPGTGWRTLTGATSQAAFGNNGNWYYPRAWLTPAGNVFVLGADGTTYELTIAGTGSLTPLATQVFAGSYYYPSVMYAPGKILTIRNSREVFVVNVNGSTPVVARTNNIDSARYWASGTVLANGNVLVTGGSTVPNTLTGVDYTAEIWNPATGHWTAGANATKPRLYHSIALLLPDGSVLTGAGGAPGPVANLNAEIYYPPYLYLNDGSGNPAPRPSLSGTPTAVTSGQKFTATVGATDQIGSVAFVRTGSDTHSNNPDQRFVGLPFTQSGDTLTITLPTNNNILLPGYWMLFVINKAGTPSVAPIILVSH